MGHPPRLAGATLACLLLLFAVTESAVKCSIGCRGMQPNKAYHEGKTYVYSLDGLSVTSVTDAKEEASLKLAATVEMAVKPDCVHQLWLKDVQINGAAPSLPDIEKYTVQFNYHDGHIDTELCTQPGDSQASLNIKRAVVSMFQSAIMRESGFTTHHEIDVMGSCPTEFNFRKEGESVIVNKNRNLEQCAFRENVNQGLISGNMDTVAGLKSSPLLASHQEIEQRFKNGVLNKAVTKETYKLRPFSNGNAGAKTTVETTLTLKDEKDDSPPGAVSVPKSLIFEAPHPVMKSSAKALSNALNAAKDEVANGVKPDAAAKVADLVKVIRLSNKNDIMSVYQKAKGTDKKLLLDALFRAGTGEATEVGVELIKKKELTGVSALMFYASLPLVRHVHLPSVSAVTSLLDQPDLPRLGYLGVGQVIGKYCQQHPCENVPEVKQAVHKIREKVGNGKAKTREQENLIISALKALGNSQFLDDATLQKLANIAADKNVRNRVRVAATEALPNRCSMKWKNILFKILGDREEDSEVRIKSYLALVACPCPHIANHLKEILDKETVNQVGSFIQSHLRNLRASTDPEKLEAKNQLGLLKPRTKFPEDFRKFSFNNELSYKIDAFGVGSTLESNVIYSQDSFVPRSTNLNMTVELFGRNFNLMELNTRVENLDKVIEHYFGPKGKVWEKDYKDLKESNTGKKISKYIKEKYDKTVRSKREVKQADLDNFAKNVHLRSNEVDDDLDVDLSVKMFGVELAYLSYQGDISKVDPEVIIEELFEKLDKGFDIAKNLNYEFENYLQFLDAELVYPTGLGSALNLGIIGTSALRLKTDGSVDISTMLDDPENAKFRIAMEPSVSIQIAGNMVVQAPGVESGMKIVGTLHTATSTDLSVSILNGKGIDVNLGIPKKKQELISISSEVLLTTGSGDKYVAPKFGKGKDHSDCFDQLSTVLGLTVCGEIMLPYDDLYNVQQKPLFPLSGPAKFAVNLQSNDVTKYHFKILLDTESHNKRSFEILLETISRKSNKQISFLLETGLEPDIYAKMILDSPIKKLSAMAVLKNTVPERTLTLTVSHDQMEYYGRIGVLANGNKYKPVLEYKLPEHIANLASAKTGMKPGQQYNVQGTIDVSDGGHKYVMDKVALTANGQELVIIDGSVIWSPSSLKVDTKLGYGDKNLALKVDGKKVVADHYKLSVSCVPSADPNIAFNLQWEYKKGPQDLDHKLIFVHGPDQKSETNRLSLIQKAAYKMNNPKDLQLSTSNELTYKALNLKLKLDGELTRKSISTDIEAKYLDFNFGTELSAKIDTKKPGDYDVELEVEVMDKGFELKSKRSIVEPQKCKFSNSLKLKSGEKYEADAIVVYDVSKTNLNVQLDGDANLNGCKVKLETVLEANSQLVNSRALLKVDGTKYIDFLLNVKPTDNPTGSLSLNLKSLITVNGQFSYQKGKGDAALNIDIPKINRKIKATGTLAVSGTEHVGNVELFYDAEKDPSKRIKLSTISDIKKNSIDSKNTLECLNYKLELNGKGKLEGTLTNGQLDLDIDLTLPNKRYLVYKLKRNSVNKDSKYDIQVASQLIDHEKKGGPSRKLAYTLDVKDLDPQLYTFQGKAEVKLVKTDGKDLTLSWSGKNQPKGNKKIKNLNIALEGSCIPKKFQLKFGLTHDDKDGQYTVSSSLGDDLSLMSTGGLEMGNEIDTPNKGTLVIEVKLPIEKLKNLKLEASTSYLDSREKPVVEDTETLKLTYNTDKTIELETYLKLLSPTKTEVPNEGTGKLSLKILDLAPLKLSGNYKCDSSPEKATHQLNLNGNYGEKKIKVEANCEDLPKVITVNVKANGNYDSRLPDADLNLVYKRFKDENKMTLNCESNVEAQKFTLNGEIQHQDTNNLFHVTYTCPMGKIEILSKIQKLGDKEFKGEWKVDTPKGFAVADAHVDIESIDNFIINVNFDSDKIQHRKIHAEIANKPTAKAGKRVLVTVTSDGQNIVTGSTSYKKHDEDGKIVVEGNGNLKIGDNSRSSSFKYTRQQLTQEKDGEIGVAMVLNANFGPSAIVGELKLTNKEVHVFNSYCEQSKDCAQFKLQSIFNAQPTLRHQITVEVDLKKFNVPAEFGLKTNTELKNPIFDHTTNLYLHSSKDKSEYTYHAYINPKESASILTLPSREIAVILTYDLPKSKQTASYKLDLSLYLDRKNKPSDKTSLSANGDINIDKSFSLSGETKFTYPTQPKDMIVKGNIHSSSEHPLHLNLDIDVFAKKSQRISIAALIERERLQKGINITGSIEVNSRGQQLKLDLKSHLAIFLNQLEFGNSITYNDVNQKPKTMGIYYSADIKQVSALITLPDKEVFRDEWKMDMSKNALNLNRELSLLGETPRVMTFEISWNSVKFEAYRKDKPNSKLSINGQVVLDEKAEIHADTYKEGAKSNLFHILIHLDEKQFLKPEFGYSKENIAKLVEFLKNDNKDLIQKQRDLQNYIVEEVKTEGKDFIDHLKKASPNMKPLLDYYQGELNKMKDEINADENVKQVQAAFNKYFGAIVTAVAETMKQVTKDLEKLHQALQEIINNVKKSMNSVYPSLKESVDKIIGQAVEITDAAMKVASAYLTAILDIIKQHEKEIQDAVSVISEVAHSICKFAKKGLEPIMQVVEALTAKGTPEDFEVFKEKLEQLKDFQVPEAILGPIEELCKAFKGLLPTEELKDFLDAICQYVVKHGRREKVDEMSELKNIYARLAGAIHSILPLLEKQVTLDNLLEAVQIPELDFSLLSKLPGVSTLKISILNLLRNGELPTPLDLYYTYRPTLDPKDIIPPFSKSGIVADGGHFFTFDGRHLNMPGTCTYVLAQDMQDGNFSVIGNFNNGVLISVTVTEPKESMTIKNNGNILVNNKPSDYPANTKNLHAYLLQPFATIKSDYGVRVTCPNKSPMICAVHVSGFYHGKLRGLLGDGNNEPYDDYTLPSGKITESGSDFGNAYKLKSDCPAASAVEPKGRDPTCTKYFTSDNSPLSSCFNYVNPAQYRDACTAENSCLMTLAYHMACYAKGIMSTNLPPTCGNCKVGANKVEIGDTFSVKIPKQEADIIFVVEQQTPNDKVFKEMITPLMSELKEELKQQGISDVHIGLIGFSEKTKWPQHYTLNGDTNIDGEVKSMKFYEPEPIITYQEAKNGSIEEKLQYLQQKLSVELGTFRLTDAYEAAIHYPFRPGAAKAVIGVIANPCEKSPLPISLQQLRILLGHKIYRDLGLTYYHISFPKELTVSGKAQQNIVGYDQDTVYTFADSKKKPLVGNSDMKSNLSPAVKDVCADFAILSGGATFSSDNFLDAKPNQKKQFVAVTAKKVAEDLANLELEKDCACNYQYGLTGSAECKIVGRKETPSAASKAVKG
ncbi:apolipophorins [Ceratina calcarata]|uniref:Apolipophorins n=1 Tax=Ceratina calcarata TaxID=156304 RepID=A0AAJ7N6M6_9HYME|nr:apolipophorins [Ceratina calcarata]